MEQQSFESIPGFGAEKRLASRAGRPSLHEFLRGYCQLVGGGTSDFLGRIAARFQMAKKAVIGAPLTLSQASKAWIRASRLVCAFVL